MQVNEIGLCIKLASQGLGLCYVSSNLCVAEITDKKLQPVLSDWPRPIRTIYAVWQGQKQLPARVRVLVDALAAFLAVTQLSS